MSGQSMVPLPPRSGSDDGPDIRRMMRSLRYAQMEQEASTQPGERAVPPSIKFLGIGLLVAGLAAAAWFALDSGDANDPAGGGTLDVDEEPGSEPDAAPAQGMGPGVFGTTSTWDP